MNPIWRNYKPFGEQISTDPTGETTAPMRFAAMERDRADVSALDYDHARFHAWPVGRFLSVDKAGGWVIDPQSWNRYAYSRNNPLKYVDPDGLEVRIAGGDALFVAQAAMSLDRIAASNPRLGVLVSGLRASKNVHTIATMTPGDGGSTVPINREDAENGRGTGSFVYVDPDDPGFDSLLTHELSHSEDDDTGTRVMRPDCNGCASVTESKAVRMRNQLPTNKDNPQKEYQGAKVKDPKKVPPDPRKKKKEDDEQKAKTKVND